MGNTLCTLRFYSATGTPICEFPYFNNLQVQETLNAVGSWAAVYPVQAPNVQSIISDTAVQVGVQMDFGDGNGFTEVWRGLYEQDNYDSALPNQATVSASGRSILAILGNAIVYPQAGVGSATTSWSFVGAPPGKIMHDLIAAAQARGCFPSLSIDFTVSVDSSGAAWTQGFTFAYAAGTSLLQVATSMASAGLCDISMSGNTLHMYNPKTTLGVDVSGTKALMRGRDIISAPVQRDRTKIATAALVVGDSGSNVEVTNSGQISALGRIEGYMAQAGVTDSTSLTNWGNQFLASTDDQQQSVVATIVFQQVLGCPMPWRDYKAGYYIGIDIGGQIVKQRAETWTVQVGAGGPVLGQITLNDVFYDAGILLSGQLNALVGGSVVGGVGSIANLPGPNSTVPNNPVISATALTTAYYSPATGTTLAQMQISWSTPTNTDGTAFIDGLEYVIQYQLSTTPIYPIKWSQLQGHAWSTVQGNPWSNPTATALNTAWQTVKVPFGTNSAMISGLICGETYNFQIAATDVSGNTSLFSATQAFATATDNQAPATPDAPTVAASMVAVQVMSDLGSATGGTYNLAQDLDHLEVHYSYEPNFTAVQGVGSPTYLGKLIANAGMMAAQIAAVGTFQVTNTSGIYIKLIAVDESGNASQASASSGVTATLIDDSHISSLSVSKLVAGTVMATIILGSTISTAASGGRVTLDGSLDQFEVYDTGGTLIGTWNPAGLNILNDPVAGYISIASSSSIYWSPTVSLETGTGNSSLPSQIYAFGVPGSGNADELTLNGPRTLGDTATSNIQLNLQGSKIGSNMGAASAMVFNSNVLSYEMTRWQWWGLAIGQIVGGEPATAPYTQIHGSPLQNDDGGTGIYEKFLRCSTQVVTTNSSGDATVNHSASFTPSKIIVMSAQQTTGPTQFAIGTITSTTFNMRAYSPNGTAYNAGVSGSFTVWIFAFGV